ncbi:MAG TPA: hypothetical protein VKA68_14540, partial [bacterium]|nr:hypothetical protein [bacterium]
MGSLAIFPFKSEDIDVFKRNISEALSQPAVEAVLCVGYEQNACYDAIAGMAEHNTALTVILQDRLGTKRPGKGDGMNTGLQYFLDRTDHARVHFYDSDIKTFSREWITRAEHAADNGFQVVRHYFPRASTDAMITWNITKTGFALLWPQTRLPAIEQPLGGELLLTREVAEAMVDDARVLAQSDWGIDTLYTWKMFNHGFSLYETYREVGKIHKLYGRLTDIKSMLIECFAAVQSLQSEPVFNSTIRHEVEQPQGVPESVKRKTAYDIEGTLTLLMDGWTDRQQELLDYFPERISLPMLECQKRPRFGFMNEETWFEVYHILLQEFRADDPDWQE